VQKNESQANQINPEILENYRHRLLALRIELADAFKIKQVSKTYASKQSEKINACLELLSGLSNIIPGASKESPSWLQKFALKNDDERQLAVQFSQKRIAEAKKALLHIQKLSEICRKAKLNDTSVIWRTLTLSKLLKKLKIFEKSIEHIRSVGKRVEAQIQNMVKSSHRHFTTPDNIGEMIHLVNKVDELSRRVIDKKNQVRSKKQKLEQMKTWLEEQKKLIRSSTQSHRPPDPLDLETLKKEIHSSSLSSLEKSRSRLTTARRLHAAAKTQKTKFHAPSVIQLTDQKEKDL